MQGTVRLETPQIRVLGSLETCSHTLLDSHRPFAGPSSPGPLRYPQNSLPNQPPQPPCSPPPPYQHPSQSQKHQPRQQSHQSGRDNNQSIPSHPTDPSDPHRRLPCNVPSLNLPHRNLAKQQRRSLRSSSGVYTQALRLMQGQLRLPTWQQARLRN